MKQIYLVEAGNYLLGIDAAVIIRTTSADSFGADGDENTTPMIALAPFLSQDNQPLSDSEYTIIEIETSTEPQILVVNRIIGEIGAEHFAPLPLLYPEHTRQCFPKMLIHNEQPVLLLDSDGLNSVRTSLKSVYGMISLDTLRERGHRPPLEENTPALNGKGDDQFKQAAITLNETTFTTIVSWTIGEYLKHDCDMRCAIRSEELPPEYLNVLQLQGVSDAQIQRLIDKTIHKCGKFNTAALQRLRKKAA